MFDSDRSELEAFDVVVVGAGLAGSAAAAVLGRMGIGVMLVDPQPTFPNLFRAEKIESDHAALLRKLGLLADISSAGSHITRVLTARSGRLVGQTALEQYGVFYRDIVNETRRQVPPTVDTRVGRVTEVELGPALQRVTFADGTSVRTRLVVVATGLGPRLPSQLGVVRISVSQEHSLSCGFSIRRRDGEPFGFDALTYFPDEAHSCVDYLTLFAIKSEMRANLFLFRAAKHPWVRELLQNPVATLLKTLPGLEELCGPLDVVTKVEVFPVDLYVSQDHRRAGFVLIGDAFQSVCPTTGTGLSKVLTDVDVLCTECIPRWLGTPGMGREKTDEFYDHPRKRACDRTALSAALYHRRMILDPSLIWRLRRRKVHVERRLRSWLYSVGAGGR